MQSVLLYLGVQAELDDIYAWCRAGHSGIPGACRWPQAIEGLTTRFPESDELTRGDWAAVEECIAFGDVVIVTIADPRFAQSSGDHAIVALEITNGTTQQFRNSVIYCDPSEGQILEMSLDEFRLEWDAAGGKGFALRL